MARDKVKNFLRGAKRARLDSRFKLNEFIGDGDDDDLFKVKFRSKSSLNLKLKRMRDDANVEIYTFDKPKARVLKKIGRTPFSDLRKKQVNKFLNRVAVSKDRGRSNEKIVTDLEAGLYYVRVTPRRANRNSTQYRIIMKAKDLPPEITDPGGPNDGGIDSGTGGDSGAGGGSTGGSAGSGNTGGGSTGGSADSGNTGGGSTGGGGTNPTPVADDNNTFLTADPLTVSFQENTYSNNNLAGLPEGTFYLGDSDTEDWFKFDLASDAIFNLSLTGLSKTNLDTDLDVEIRNQNGALLNPALSSIGQGTVSENIAGVNLAQGTYLIRVNRAINSGESEYALTLSALPTNVDPNGAGNDFENARALPIDVVPDFSSEIYGLKGSDYDNLIPLPDDFIGGADTNDYYKVTLPTGGGFISAKALKSEDNDIDGNLSTDINLQIIPRAALDADFNIVSPDLISTSSTEEVAGSFDEGEYFIRVYPATENDGAFYQISVAAFSTLDIPVLTRDIRPGSGSSLTGSILVGDQDSGTGTGILYFAANDGEDRALWRSEGTFGTTVKIGTASNLSNLVNVNGNIYFTSDQGGSGTELWKYDGNTISQVANIAPDSNGTVSGISDPKFTTVGGTDLLFFVANDTVKGNELWATDGVNTALVADIDIGGANSDSNPDSLKVVGDMLYFSASDNNGDKGLYRINTNTLDLATVNPETSYQKMTSAALNADALPENLTLANDKLYFTATGSDDVFDKLWVINDPTAETVTVSQLADPTAFGLDINENPGYSEFVEFDGTLFFVASDNENTSGIWKVNAAGTGVEQVAELGGVNDLNPEQLTVMGDQLFFIGSTLTDGRELWVSDGSTELFLGTTLGNYQKTTSLSSIDHLTVVGTTTPKLYFSADDGVNGTELWTSNGDVSTVGTTAGTKIVADINSETDELDPSINLSSNPENLVVIGNRLFFKANNGINGEELWVLGIQA